MCVQHGMLECVFQRTARGMSHLLNVAFIPPPNCLVCFFEDHMSTEAYCAYCKHICLCVHASLLPESSHNRMFQVTVDIPRALLTSTLTQHVKPPPVLLHTSQSLCASLSSPPSDGQIEIEKRFPHYITSGLSSLTFHMM